MHWCPLLALADLFVINRPHTHCSVKTSFLQIGQAVSLSLSLSLSLKPPQPQSLFTLSATLSTVLRPWSAPSLVSPEYRACLLSVLAGYELRKGGGVELKAQLKALLAMAPGRRNRANALPAHSHGLTLEVQLALHRQPDQSRTPLPLLPANKLLKSMLLTAGRTNWSCPPAAAPWAPPVADWRSGHGSVAGGTGTGGGGKRGEREVSKAGPKAIVLSRAPLGRTGALGARRWRASVLPPTTTTGAVRPPHRSQGM